MQADAAPLPLTPWSSDRSSVVAALRSAAAATGSDFHYLLGTAMRESSLRPGAQSSTSSAAGLFQFIDQTWLGLVKNHGAQYGLGGYADAIHKGSDGRYHADAGMRQAILALRKDPQASALMAGEYAKATQSQLQAALGRDVCGGELYAAHFLGPDAACRLIRLNQTDPSASAAAQFPQAAGANRNVFFHGNGAPKSVREVYDWAIRQPGTEGTVRVATLPDITTQTPPPPQPIQQRARTMAASAHDAEIQMLLASVMNWQPRANGFGGGLGVGLGGLMGGATPLTFGPGLLSLLSDARSGSDS
ncbi:MAG: hypothetical protein BGN85_12935 [Alphaproteobacteria bacterium 64-11]|nr:hypothetical protein [Alphaproteobacteria bacterium]OJU09680.1 MAG: hypothetical protein BGN85_12935 [Alphaproteobacteria bacterium 64-11]